MSAEDALDFVRRHGVALESARGPVPSLAGAVAGEAIHGSWWAHPRAFEIFWITRAVRSSPEVLVCRLVDGKVTFVHRRLWPALVRLAGQLPRQRLAAIEEVHTPSGKHEARETPFPAWVPVEVVAEAERLDEAAATDVLEEVLGVAHPKEQGRSKAGRQAPGEESGRA